MLPFTAEILFSSFEQSNRALWPFPPVAPALALAILTLALRPVRGGDRAIGALLALAWLWVGLGYFILHFAAFDFAAPIYGAFFVVEALLLGWSAVVRNRLAFRFTRHLFGWCGLALALAAALAWPLADALFGPGRFSVDQVVIESYAHRRAVELTLALCLAEDALAQPGLPSVQGQWISRKTFAIKLRTAPSLFDIRPIPDQEWRRMGFPARTFTLIERTRNLNEEIAEDETVAIGYIHEDAYSAMANGPNGMMLQAMVAVDMLVDVILESREELEDVEAAQPGTPLERLLARLSRGGEEVTIIELRQLLGERRKLKALFQAKLDVVSLIR